MLRYHLDELGWYQFEWLIQSLLKSDCSLSIENWGNSGGDNGKDAFTNQNLKYPTKDIQNHGPFVFQIKFIENANASGAKPDQALSSAIEKEIKRIHERIDEGKWDLPNYYTLITNVSFSSTVRNKLLQKLQKGLNTKNIILWGGSDVCDRLDANESIRRSFPQLLSLRDLDELIRGALTKESRERSYSAIENARNIAPVFVPTHAYVKCWEVLKEHRFAVLEGPPEVGKTAIAWMVGLSLISQGWECISCDKPEDFFQNYSGNNHQIFIADDAFGRTEYQVTRGQEWEKYLGRIIFRLDNQHWLIWTSRKNILERAKQIWDLEGPAQSFPTPGDVLIDANALTRHEKALILYRHAKAARLSEQTKLIIKGNISQIIDDPSFTPERIRRFIINTIPVLSENYLKGEINHQQVSREIRKAIETPTDHMKKSFKALPSSHKIFLVSLLETSRNDIFISDCRQIFQQRASLLKLSENMDQMIDELSESFVRIIERKKR